MKSIVLYTGIPFLVLLILGCTSQINEEQQLLDTLDAAVEAIEERDSRRVLSLLSEDVLGPEQKHRDELAGMLMFYFRQYRQVRVFLRDTRVNLQSPQADVTTIASVVGASERWPDSAQQFEVRMRWQKDGDAWKLNRIQWQVVDES